MLERMANAALFQLGWFACVGGGNSLWLLVPTALPVVRCRITPEENWQACNFPTDNCQP